MFFLLRFLFKIFFLAIFLFGVFQIEYKNKKIYSYMETFAAEMVYKYGSILEDKFNKSMKKRIARYLKNKISETLEDDKKINKEDSPKSKTEDIDLDEEKIREIIGD